MKPTKPLPCGEARDLADLFARQALGAEAQASLRAHVAGCEACRAVVEDAVAVVGFLKSAPRVACPDDLTARIRALAFEEGRTSALEGNAPAPRRVASTKGIGRWLLRPSWLVVPALAASAAVVLLLAGGQIDRALRGASPTALRSISSGETRGSAATGAAETMDAEAAAAETRLALRILAESVQRASRVASQELGAGVARPVVRGLEESIVRIPPPFDPTFVLAPGSQRT